MPLPRESAAPWQPGNGQAVRAAWAVGFPSSSGGREQPCLVATRAWLLPPSATLPTGGCLNLTIDLLEEPLSVLSWLLSLPLPGWAPPGLGVGWWRSVAGLSRVGRRVWGRLRLHGGYTSHEAGRQKQPGPQTPGRQTPPAQNQTGKLAKCPVHKPSYNLLAPCFLDLTLAQAWDNCCGSEHLHGRAPCLCPCGFSIT